MNSTEQFISIMGGDGIVYPHNISGELLIYNVEAVLPYILFIVYTTFSSKYMAHVSKPMSYPKENLNVYADYDNMNWTGSIEIERIEEVSDTEFINRLKYEFNESGYYYVAMNQFYSFPVLLNGYIRIVESNGSESSAESEESSAESEESSAESEESSAESEESNEEDSTPQWIALGSIVFLTLIMVIFVVIITMKSRRKYRRMGSERI